MQLFYRTKQSLAITGENIFNLNSWHNDSLTYFLTFKLIFKIQVHTKILIKFKNDASYSSLQSLLKFILLNILSPFVFT